MDGWMDDPADPSVHLSLDILSRGWGRARRRADGSAVDGDDADDDDGHSENTNGVHAHTRPDDDNRFPVPVTEGEEGGSLGFLQTLLMADVESEGLGSGVRGWYKMCCVGHSGSVGVRSWVHIMTWRRRCRERWSDREKERSHSVHRNGLIPVCFRKCRVSSSERAKRQVQPSQVQW